MPDRAACPTFMGDVSMRGRSASLGLAALLFMAIAALPATPTLAQDGSGGLPGARGVDHIGITVPDMAQAETFFTEVIGCRKAMSFGPFADDQGTFMKDLLGVHPRAVIEQITLLRCGFGANIELFKYSAPDQVDMIPRNSDIGGHHIGIYVDDIQAAKGYLDEKGVPTRLGPLPVTEGPAAGQTILYFQAPWGLQLEAISYPGGMAYEKEADTILWSPKDPAR